MGVVATAAAVLGLLAVSPVYAFDPPDAAQRQRAAGALDTLPPALQRAFSAGEGFFDPIPKPGSSDWLANHPEEGQTFDQFVRSEPNRPDRKRGVLYFQPLGRFDPETSPSLDQLRQFASAFFMMEVKLLEPIDVAKANITTRKNPHTHNTQLYTLDILALLQKKLPADAYALLAITMEDLYPDPKWNFVFGQASLRERVGVYSFARYDPAFYGDNREANWKTLMLRRSCKVLAHETIHMFGIQHCVYYSCLINGSNHLQEADSRPLHLCPIDLRKLQWSVGFDVPERHKKLQQFCKGAGLEEEDKWLGRRIEYLR